MGIISSAMLHSWKEMGCLDNGNSEELEQLKAENARLKEELATYGATGVCEVCSDKANKLADKYLGCLQDIKAIAERGFNNSQCNCGLRADIDQIIQKITQAESEE